MVRGPGQLDLGFGESHLRLRRHAPARRFRRGLAGDPPFQGRRLAKTRWCRGYGSPQITVHTADFGAFALGVDGAVAVHTIQTSASPPHGGTTGGGAYALNASAMVSAVAAPGYKFSKWTENGNVVSTSANHTFTVTGDRQLVAKFKPIYVINVVNEPADGGETEVDAVYEMGELAKLKAVPADVYSFVNWTQNGVPVSTERIFQFNVTGNRDLVANFAAGRCFFRLARP